MEEKPTHTVFIAPGKGGKNILHSLTAKNSSEAMIKAKLWQVESDNPGRIKMVVEHAEGPGATGHSSITFNADQIDPAAEEIMEDLDGQQAERSGR